MNPPFHSPLVCPSANLSSFHLPHTETHQWGPHPSSLFQEISALPRALISHWGTRFCICTSVPNLFIIYCTNPFIFRYLLLSSPLATYFHFGNTQPMSPLVGALLLISLTGIVYIFIELPISLTYTLRICSLCPASGTTYPWSWRPPDTRPCHTVVATVCLIHSPAKGSLESSHFLTSSMYLCHFLTIVDFMKPFASGSCVPLLLTSTQFSRRATVS
jgi:hypothetical protein